MVEIGGRPIIWHLLKFFYAHGVTEFVICAGYLGYQIKEYFANYAMHLSDVTFDGRTGEVIFHELGKRDRWTVTVADTGEATMTGGRLARIRDYLGSEDFLMTYGDGLSNVDIPKLLQQHRQSSCQATVTAVRAPARFGAIDIDEESMKVSRFEEKPLGDRAWINGGFFVLNPGVLDLIDGDHVIWEHDPLAILVERGELGVYKHSDFWKPMDTLRDKNELERMWMSGEAPWKIW